MPRTSQFLDALRSSIGPRSVITDRQVTDQYRRDHAPLLDSELPLAVVRARSLDDVVRTLRTTTRFGVPIVARGAGTGLSGGANGIARGIILSLADLNAIIEIDQVGRTATVEAGVLNGHLAYVAAEQGLWYVPDPASRETSTIGGNIATNAGGGCCAKYGVTGDHVARLKAVLVDGTVIHTGSTTLKNVAGYDLTRLLVGSEGSLAVIVEATVRLRRRPRHLSTIVAAFDSMTEAGQALLAIDQAAEPSLLELMDRTTIAAVERSVRMGLDESSGALLIAQSDSTSGTRDIQQACNANRATYVACTDDPDEAEVFLHARRSALPSLERLGTTLLDDVVVPKRHIAQLIADIEEVALSEGLVIGTFGHAGDGNLHPTIVFDANSDDSSRRARRAFDRIIHAALRYGGSITGEHGVGMLKAPYLTSMIGLDEHQLMRRIKSAFDPHGLLNPGRAI